MYRSNRTFVTAESKVASLIFENPSLLLLLEHFKIELSVHGMSIRDICLENKVSERVFITFTNLYNGFYPSGNEGFTREDVPSIILFLKNSHDYYKQEKYPEMRQVIEKINQSGSSPEINLVERFFDEYFQEVREHLDYEDNIAFPYIHRLLQGLSDLEKAREKFSINDYREHHTDIESKLADLKNLLVKHISLRDNRILHRKLLFSLFELENDLFIHSLIEESILIPLVIEIEGNLKNG